MYRRQIEKDLGLNISDKNINNVSSAPGSSFDGKKYKKNALQMKVLSRDKEMQNDKRFENIMASRNLQIFYNKILELYKKYKEFS